MRRSLSMPLHHIHERCAAKSFSAGCRPFAGRATINRLKRVSILVRKVACNPASFVGLPRKLADGCPSSPPPPPIGGIPSKAWCRSLHCTLVSAATGESAEPTSTTANKTMATSSTGTCAEVGTDVDPRGLLAGLLFRSMELDFDEAYNLLCEIPEEDLDEWSANWRESGLGELVFSTKDVSVIDTVDKDVILRSLHFNDRIDVVQSCVVIDPSNRQIVHTDPPPLHGVTGTCVQGLSIALAAYYALRDGVTTPRAVITARETCSDTDTGADVTEAADDVRTVAVDETQADETQADETQADLTSQIGIDARARIAVLGAGACTLAGFLHSRFAHAQIDAVEISSDVCAAARAHFGVAEMEQSDRFRLHAQDVRAWLEECPPSSLDLLLVDVEDGDHKDVVEWLLSEDADAGDTSMAEASQLIAPPEWVLNPSFAQSCARVLAPNGLVAINCLGEPEAVSAAAQRCRSLHAFAACRAPRSALLERDTEDKKLVQSIMLCSPTLVHAPAPDAAGVVSTPAAPTVHSPSTSTRSPDAAGSTKSSNTSTEAGGSVVIRKVNAAGAVSSKTAMPASVADADANGRIPSLTASEINRALARLPPLLTNQSEWLEGWETFS